MTLSCIFWCVIKTWTCLCVSGKPWVTSRWNYRGFFLLHGFLKCHHKSLCSGKAKPCYTSPKGLPYPSLYSHSTAPQILFHKVSMSACSLFLILFFSTSTPLCLSCPFSFIRPCPRLLIYVLEEQLSRAGREVGQAGWLQALQGSKHWAHCLKHTLALAHTHACTVLLTGAQATRSHPFTPI